MTILAYATPAERAELRQLREQLASAEREVVTVELRLQDARKQLATAGVVVKSEQLTRARRLIGDLAIIEQVADPAPAVAQLRQDVDDLYALLASYRDRCENFRLQIHVAKRTMLKNCAERCAVEYAKAVETIRTTWAQLGSAELVGYSLKASRAPGGEIGHQFVYLPTWAKLNLPGSLNLEPLRKIEQLCGGEYLLHGETDVERGCFMTESRSLEQEFAQ